MSDHIFVFGSNLAGRHGAGSALVAMREHGALYGIGSGPTGRAYAIPTKGFQLEVLPLEKIREYVDEFIDYARRNHEKTFNIVAIGCGLAGYDPDEIAPMFEMAPINCILPKEFRR